ncbi:MAG: hypothetical protein LAN63_12360 [Acidobacteriia bacterium]|nr:hypothetical protein [Terriglobia bacterium]
MRPQTALVLQFREKTSGVHPHRVPQNTPHTGFLMAGTRKKIVVILLAAFLCLGIAVPAYATQRRAASKRATKPEPAATVVEVVPPPAPLTLEQQPASPPRISYQGGQLTITAHNSTLGDILRGVHAQTGAAMDVPGNATERVVGRFGPGPAREVLAALLNGSHFNYVMLGSAANPDGLERVILTSKAGGVEASSVAQLASQPVAPTRPSVEPQEDAQDGNGDEDFSDDQLAEQPGDEAQPDQNQDASQQQPDQQQQQQQGFPNGQPGIRSPEQLLRELQQRQLLQQQQGTQPQGQPPTGFPVPPGQQPQPQPPQ